MKKILLLFVVLIAVLLLAAGLSGCSGSSFQPTPTNQFAFVRQASTQPFIASARLADQKGSHQLGALADLANAAALPGGSDSIVLMNNDGSGEKVVANRAGHFVNVQLSNDGLKTVFTAVDANGRAQIYIADTANLNNATQLTNDAENHLQAQLSFDKSKVVFIKNAQLFVISSSGGQEMHIATPAGDPVFAPTFTPDGRIIYEDDDCDSLKIVNADADGTGLATLTNSNCQYFDQQASVSADGKTLVFLRNWDVYKADLSLSDNTVSNITRLTTTGGTGMGTNYDPLLVKDKVVYISEVNADHDGDADVWSVDLNGNNDKQLTAVDNYALEYFDVTGFN